MVLVKRPCSACADVYKTCIHEKIRGLWVDCCEEWPMKVSFLLMEGAVCWFMLYFIYNQCMHADHIIWTCFCFSWNHPNAVLVVNMHPWLESNVSPNAAWYFPWSYINFVFLIKPHR